MDSSALPGISKKPGAVSFIITGDAAAPKIQKKNKKIEKKRNEDSAKRLASFFPFLLSIVVKTGTYAVVSEPSARSLLKRFGILNATKKASAAVPAPKKEAITISLTNPSILLKRVERLTIPAEVKSFFT